MVLPFWGQLEKAQDDDTTLESYIASEISDHNDDPDAHLASGGSLESHKTEGVIDHPPRSVLDDKFAWDRNFLDLDFRTLDGLGTVGTVEQNGADSLYLHSANSSTPAQVIGSSSDMDPDSKFAFSQHPRLLGSFMRATNNNAYMEFGMLETDEGNGFGFICDGSTLNGFYYDDENNVVDYALTEISLNTVYKLEALVLDSGQIEFYINDELIHTTDDADLPTSFTTRPEPFWLDFHSKDSNSSEMYFRAYHWEADIPS